MASSDPLRVENQTDKDLFDQLVGDDEFGLGGSDNASEHMAKALSNLGLGNVDTSIDNLEAEDKLGDEKVLVSDIIEKADLIEKSTVAEGDNVFIGEHVQSRDFVKPGTEVGSPGSLSEKSSGYRGTSIKVVQWSSFGSGQEQPGGCGSELDSDLFSGIPDGTANQWDMRADDKCTLQDSNMTFGSFESGDPQAPGVPSEQAILFTASDQSNSQAYEALNEHVEAVNNSQYWENTYPGWTYDGSTGQWYQVDGYATATNGQADDYGSSIVDHQECLQASTELTEDSVTSGQKSDISYLQQTTQSVVETLSGNCVTGNVSNWNQVSQENIDYPSNMVFDPQYPGWYFDTNTLEWYSLESYTQSLQTAPDVVSDQITQEESYLKGGFNTSQNRSLCNTEVDQMPPQVLGSQYESTQEHGDWRGYSSSYHQHGIWQQEKDVKNETAFGVQAIAGSFYNAQSPKSYYLDQQPGIQAVENVKNPWSSSSDIGVKSFSTFVPAQSNYQFSRQGVEQLQDEHIPQSHYLNQNTINYSQQFSQNERLSFSQFSYNTNGGRKLDGKPPHALVTFGFGGKLIVMKDTSSTSMSYSNQDATKGDISVLNLAEVVREKTEFSAVGSRSCNYFHSLCKQSLPGPLVGGSVATKDLNKWIDERIATCESSTTDFRKGELLRLLFSLLKISLQHYGKLRSPFGLDPSLQEVDSPELAVTGLFASARKNSDQLREYGTFTHCMHHLPSEAQLRKTAVEVQNLLVSGRRKEALQCAQEGQLWGVALVLAAQLGDKFYIDSVKQMAHLQFVSGSPLRTLCLLIAGQPADVFSADSSSNSFPGAVNIQQPAQVSAAGMLDDWEENLAVITANRTKDDELVIIHLGDCLWKERGEVTAAHTCYLVAEAKFEPYSDKARLCLIGADHWKCPRTYASPEAIQRTEFYEYSKVLGNSQFILLPFQPYKLVYAYMLAEVGKVSDSLKYCQAILRSLKNSGRDPEVEAWKGLVLSLEERIRGHQQGGFGTNLAPAKLVGKLFTSIDRSLHRMIGAPPLPPVPPNNLHGNEHDNAVSVPKIGNSQSMGMSSLPPSASVETISEWTGDNRKVMHNRSISEPDFGRSPKQRHLTNNIQGQTHPSSDASSTAMHNKASGTSRFGRFGSQIFQKTIGWMSRNRQAKLGESNKFYYDEKLKRWVEEGGEPPVEEAALPPPPTTASFLNHVPKPNTNDTFPTQNSIPNGLLEAKTSKSIEHSPGIPPMPPAQNQFSARGRTGVRSRYVDTFNRGGGISAASFQSPSVPSVKPTGGAEFFVPSPAPSSESMSECTESNQLGFSTEDGSTSAEKGSSSPPFPSSSSTMHRITSMDNIPSTRNKGMGVPSQNGMGSLSSRARAASWCGSYYDAFSLQSTDTKASGGEFSVSSSFTTNSPSPLRPATTMLSANGGGSSDDLHEVEL